MSDPIVLKLIEGRAVGDPVYACVDCAHHYHDRYGLADKCYRIVERSPVSGKIERMPTRSVFCIIERGNFGPVDTCGSRGKYWTPKPPKPKSLWQRLKARFA